MDELQETAARKRPERLHSEVSYKQLQQGSFRWPPIMNGVMKLSPVEFAALFDGLDWTRVQTIKTIPTPTVAV